MRILQTTCKYSLGLANFLVRRNWVTQTKGVLIISLYFTLQNQYHHIGFVFMTGFIALLIQSVTTFYIYIYIYIYTHTHTRARTHTHTHTHVSTVTSSLPLLGNGSQRQTIPFL
jgi:hypothetical protein